MNAAPFTGSAFVTDQSLFFVITGAIGVGKTRQIASAIQATDDDGAQMYLPCLYLLAEASAYGTAGPLLQNPACVVWPVTDCDDALDAASQCFPDGGPLTVAEARKRAHEARCKAAAKDKRPAPAAPPPIPEHIGRMTLRSLAVDTLTTLHKGSQKTAMAIEKEKIEAGGNKRIKTTRTTDNFGALNNSRDQHRFAAMRCDALTDRLNGISQHHPGVLILVSVHTRPAEMDVVIGSGENAVTEKRVCGETPDLGATKVQAAGVTSPGWPAAWNNLAAKANIIWHAFAEYPDLGAGDLQAANDRASEQQPVFGVITMRGKYPKLGFVQWVKSQGTHDEPIAHFVNLPAIWSASVATNYELPAPSPDLGVVLRRVVASTLARHAVAC